MNLGYSYSRLTKIGLPNSFANRFSILVFCQNSQNLLCNRLAVGFNIYNKLTNSPPFLAFMYT
jgi:hypothetical protein